MKDSRGIISVDDLEDQKPTMPPDEAIVEYKEKIKNDVIEGYISKRHAVEEYNYE